MSKIQDYGFIGNCRSAALVSRHGSIDWLCWPRFDSRPIFGHLLGGRGAWTIAPLEVHKTYAQYVENTNVLQTIFYNENGKVIVTDFMPVVSEEDKKDAIYPEQEILRKVECCYGKMEMSLSLSIDSFERCVCKNVRGRGAVARWQTHQGLLSFCSPIKVAVKDNSLETKWTIQEGDVHYFSLNVNEETPAVFPLVDASREKSLQETIHWWKSFVNQIPYEGDRRPELVRSALVLKLLSFNPSGAIIASPTTSLPEKIGGNLNWDYRYCWLRDASFTASALLNLNLKTEAFAFINWLLHSTNLSRPKLKVLYDVYGRKPQTEKTDELFPGYEDSRPVRFGNAAMDQEQLDLYGEVIHAAYQVLSKEEKIDAETQKMLRQLGKYICEHWQEPDAGMWEVRGHLEHFTHSLVLCWRGLNDLLALYHFGLLKKVDVDTLNNVQREISHAIDELGWNDDLQSYTSQLRGDKIDANLLLMPWYGFLPFNSLRMQKTYEHIKKELGGVDGLLYRNRDQEEGIFILCSLWAAEYMANKEGGLKEAEKILDAVLDHANHLGLLSEELDPNNGDLLGNFPLAFSHLGVINAILAVDRAEKQSITVEELEQCIL